LKTFISEAKQVGDVYHFTKQHNLESILDSVKIHSHSGHISATRNHNLPMDMSQKNGDFSFDKGYNVRLTLDGNKIKHISIIPNSEENMKHANETLKPKLEKHGIPHYIGKKFHPTKIEENNVSYNHNEWFTIEIGDTHNGK
jgi:hypothetical protein